MSDGFFSRWSRRKEAVREGKPLEPEAPAASAEPAPAPVGPVDAAPAEAAPPPTLEDAQSLTPESDFRRFVASDVSPDVKNTALKRLFSDPHFNEMDGLDVYIDDYSKPDPIPESMLRQLASAQFLDLFDERKNAERKVREAADKEHEQTVAQSDAAADPAVPPTEHHADPDLRLQQDDAPGPEGPGRGTE